MRTFGEALRDLAIVALSLLDGESRITYDANMRTLDQELVERFHAALVESILGASWKVRFLH